MLNLTINSKNIDNFYIAVILRKQNSERIVKQIEPSGKEFAPRNIKTRKKRRKKNMFMRIKNRKYLKIKATASFAQVSFVAQATCIAKIHHFGLSDINLFTKKPAHYPARKLLGFAPQDLALIDQTIINHLNIKYLF